LSHLIVLNFTINTVAIVHLSSASQGRSRGQRVSRWLSG